MSEQSKDLIAAHLKQSLAALERATHDAAMLASARKIADVLIAPSDDTAVIQQIHLAVAHGICEEIEQALMREPPRK